ncbi:hypothetical protein [Nitratireductor soli]|uniref:hypothetical protein n=1 Tax=Nitratireductor soli TaxID=1670619 RepID=UPI00065E0532|nr:hypothetical protein [Nitratireductor soli]
MAALTEDRNTPQALGDMREGLMAAATTIFAGAIVMRNAAGHLTRGATATGLVGVGRAETRAVNAGSAGDASAKYRPGIFRFANSAAADEITISEIGTPCFAVDDQTVAKTDGTGTRSIAGFVDHVDAQGVWVRFDETLVRTHLSGITNPV